MSNVRALRAQHQAGNPGLRLVVNSLPGSNNFPIAVVRIISLIGVIAAVSGAYYLVGGYPAQLWQPKTFFAMLGITFFLSTRHIGARNTITGFISGLLGPVQNQEDGVQAFNHRIGRWAMTSGHVFALLTLAQTLTTRVMDLPQLIQALSPAAIAYLYAIVMAVTLPARNHKEGTRFALGEVVLPAIALVAGYFVMNYLNR